MVISFSEKDSKKIVANLENALGSQELRKVVTFSLAGQDLIVTISKVGKSTLTFKHSDTVQGCEFKLQKEKVAFSHRAFKGEVTAKIYKIVELIGGTVS